MAPPAAINTKNVCFPCGTNRITLSPPLPVAQIQVSGEKLEKIMAKAAVVMCMAAVVVLVVVMAGGASAAQCDAGKLVVCAPAIIGGAAPSASCCSNLRAQQGCFCQYARNPAYGRYINSPTARRAITSCRISIPRC